MVGGVVGAGEDGGMTGMFIHIMVSLVIKM